MKPGTVLRDKKYEGSDKTKPKYLIVLTSPHPDGEVSYFLTTTEKKHYDKFPQMYNEVVIVPPGTLAYFPDPKDTIIQCHNFESVHEEKLYDKYSEGGANLEVVGTLPNDILTEILKAVKESKRLTPNQKEIIEDSLGPLLDTEE